MTAPALISHLKGNKNAVSAIAFKDNDQFAAASLDKTVAIYSVKNKNSRCIKFENPDEIYDFDWSSKNFFACVGDSKVVSIFEAVMSKGYTEKIVAHQSFIRSVHFSNSGNRIITGSNDKSIKLWRLSHRNFVKSYTGHLNFVNCVRFSPDNKMLASCSDDKTLKVFDVENGDLIHSWKDEKGYGNQVCWHKDNNSIAVAQENGRVKIFDLKQRKLVQYYRIFDSPVKCLDFHPSGCFMITGDESGLTKVLDLLEGRDIFTIQGHQDAVTAVKFSKDGEYFVTGSKDKHLMVFKSNISIDCIKDDEDASYEELSSKHLENKENEGGSDKRGVIVDSKRSEHYNYSSAEDIDS